MKTFNAGPKLLLLLLACALAAAFSARTAAQRPHPLDALDRAVQKRFHEVISFGMARIATERRFAPETAEEKQAVRDLKRAGYKVSLYLAGRGVLEPVPEERRVPKTTFGGGMVGQAVSGPIFVSARSDRRLPTAAALWDETRRAFESFAAGADRHGFSSGGWEVEARPVRASDESCLRCHAAEAAAARRLVIVDAQPPAASPKADSLKVGDPLGVLLYVYRQSP